MTKLKLFSVYCLMAVVTLFFAACGSDDNDEIYDPSDSTASALIGTWYMDEYTSITFNKDGSGMFKTSEYDDEDEDDEAYSRLFAQVKSEAVTRADNSGIMSISFRWKYTANPPQIRITMQGKPMVWKIVSVSENSLVVVDDDGETVGFYKKTAETPVTPNKVGPKELLYGDWGVAGIKLYGFRKDGTSLWFSFDDGSVTGTSVYAYNENTHKLCMDHHGTADNHSDDVEVVVLTPTVLGIAHEHEYWDQEGDHKIVEKRTTYYSRINDDEKITIGHISLLYDKKLYLTGVEGGDIKEMTLTFRSSGMYTMTVDGEGGMSKYSYDESTHKLLLIGASYDVIKLTETSIILVPVDELGDGRIPREFVAI